MFDAKELESFERDYFCVICTDDYDVTVKSRSTGHYWNLHYSEGAQNDFIVLYHKHEWRRSYHVQRRVTSVKQAVNIIKKHDEWLLKQAKKQHKRLTGEPLWRVY